MKRILKEISKVGVFTMVLSSFLCTLKSENIEGMPGAILFVIGWLCASYYFIVMEE